FYTLPVDMVTQILNFGLPAPIDVQVVGPNLEANRLVADRLLNQIKYVPGTSGLRIQQPFDNPKLTIDANRSMAESANLQERDIAQSLLVASSGSFQTSPTFYLDPRNGVEYDIVAQAEQYNLDTLQDLRNIPVTSGSGGGAAANSASYGAGLPPGSAGPVGGQPIQILGNVASIAPGEEMGMVTHYNITPVLDIYGNVTGTDLASVSRKIQKIVDRNSEHLPRGTRLVIRGQVRTMTTAFRGLLLGLLGSIVLVYLLIVINFQSWLDPFIIVTALPAAVSGIVWFLFLTDTRLSVPALTGAIMCMGVATSNSILVVSFAREQLEVTVGDAPLSALNAGYVRFRPVLMTALAMIIGMVPMSLGLGSGGEQNAPLGRAVIGGLLFATVSTLFFVPTVFSAMHARRERRRQERESKRHGHHAVAGSEA
ncbi:MAG: efflux RND transporter permease subunit, partial [Acidobacteriaceae bacterium]